VKIFLNLPEILAEVDRAARQLAEPTAFYLGKLQDGLALDPLTGYSRQIIPFFAAHPTARLTMLTKSTDVGNLIGLDHQGHAILSWTVDPTAVIEAFGRARFPQSLREDVYRHLLQTIRRQDADVEIGLCLEEPSVFDSLDMGQSMGRCNCVL